MTIPKYVQEIMGRASFMLGDGDPGYTIRIAKATPYTKVSTLKMEIEKLNAWVKRQLPPYDPDLDCPAMIVNQMPTKTHYCKQNAVITIYDPVMKELEKYIPNK